MPRRYALYWTVFAGGGVLMALEILASRILAPHFGNSVYVWGSIISVFLAALSLGYYIGGRVADRRPHMAGLARMVLLCAASVGLLLVTGPRLASAFGDLTRGAPWGTLVAAAVLFIPSSVLLATLSPYAIRLAAHDLEHLGGTAGRLYAISTAGSLVGTVGCTFGLIPFLDLGSALIVLLAAISLTVLVPALAAGRPARGTVVLTAVLFVAAVAGRLEPPQAHGVVYERMTPYQTLRVQDRGGIRYLESDRVRHGAIRLEDGETAYSYNRVLPAALLLQPEIERVLVIGMGGGNVAHYLQDRLPDLEIDLVDVDAAVPEIAAAYMGFEERPGIEVHVADGRRFLLSAEERWDLVFVDAYIGLSVPFHLTTREFLELVRERLEPGGLFALNLGSGLSSPFSRAMVRTVADVFPEVVPFQVPAAPNVLVFAGGPGLDAEAGTLARRARALDGRLADGARFDPTLSELADLRFRGEVDLSDVPVLTDRFAPVDRLIHLRADVPVAGTPGDGDADGDGEEAATPTPEPAPESAPESVSEPVSESGESGRPGEPPGPGE